PILHVVSHARRGREVEALKAASPGVVENRIYDDIDGLQMPTHDRPDFRRVPPLIPVFRVVAEFEIRPVKELAIIGSGRCEQKADLSSVDLGAEILIDAVER